MKIAKDIEIPDECPADCQFKEDFRNFGQQAMCGRCPIFCCETFPDDDFCLIEPDDFRRDWALEWKKFFETGEVPGLRF